MIIRFRKALNSNVDFSACDLWKVSMPKRMRFVMYPYMGEGGWKETSTPPLPPSSSPPPPPYCIMPPPC